MKELVGGDYRDSTRLKHMLQALERIEEETRDTSRDKLFFDDRLTRAIILDFIVLGEAAIFEWGSTEGDAARDCRGVVVNHLSSVRDNPPGRLCEITQVAAMQS